MLCSAYVLIKPLTINNCSSLGISQNVSYPPVQSLIIFFLLSALTCVLTRSVLVDDHQSEVVLVDEQLDLLVAVLVLCSRTRFGFGPPVQGPAAGHFPWMGAAREGLCPAVIFTILLLLLMCLLRLLRWRRWF